MIQPGVYTNLSSADYHNETSSISRSALIEFDRSPFHYWARYLNPERPEKNISSAMELGAAFHAMILEPELFNAQYILKPEPVLLKDVGREAYDRYKSELEACENSGRIAISMENFDILTSMRSRILNNPQAYELLQGARIENSFFWRDAETELMLKARPDALQKNIYIDLKSCTDGSPRAFQSSMVAGGYHVQAAMTQEAVLKTEGHLIENFIFIAVETKYPYSVAIYILDDVALEAGREKFRSLVYDLAQCLKNNEWPGYGIMNVSLPKWAL